jgi:propionyl-CoA carboxylase alpha chain
VSVAKFPFSTLLIANRGEIACRVIRTARALGLKTVAVYSDADRDARHVEMADSAVGIGPAPAAQSYLDMDKIIAAAKQSGAGAIHPGYGFLSENARFARRLSRSGIVFVGPPPKAIEAMGDKIESKRLAQAAGVSTIPGHTEAIADAAEAVRIAKRIGYPVMLKASAGGGGKGMRIARTDAEVRDGLAGAMREAKASFGDDRVFIEKYIESPRHIEIQVLADGHGKVLYLGERECSIQRRHQKVLEECPSPFLDEVTRAKMGEQAVALSRAVGYRSAGTVEFIVDPQRNFYFLEMNTRLQVEHPVTELVTGLDLVEWMLRIAAGERLPLDQKDVRLNGSAVEARVYAEDPVRGFLPSIGRLVRYREPEGEGVRVDSGVAEGSEIGVHYDPMIAKLVAHGPDRATAISRLRLALDSFYIRGLTHNIPFLSAVVATPRFAEGRLSTDFIAETYPQGFAADDAPNADSAAVAAVTALVHRALADREGRISGRLPGNEPTARDAWVVRLRGVEYEANIVLTEGGADVRVGERVVRLCTAWRIGQVLFEGTADGAPIAVQIEPAGIGYRVQHGGLDTRVLVLTPDVARYAKRVRPPRKRGADKSVRSPMPGFLLSLAVAAGQAVKAGEELAVVEAMKMENVIRAASDGVVAAVRAKAGDSLAVDQVILEFA